MKVPLQGSGHADCILDDDFEFFLKQDRPAVLMTIPLETLTLHTQNDQTNE